MSTCENVPGLAAAAELDIIPDREEQIMYPTEFRIQIRDQLCTLCGDLTKHLSIGFKETVDFRIDNIYSVEPTNKEPNNSPNTDFTVTLCWLTDCPGKGLLVQFKTGNLPTEPPNLVGTPSLIPSPKPKK